MNNQVNSPKRGVLKMGLFKREWLALFKDKKMLISPDWNLIYPNHV